MLFHQSPFHPLRCRFPFQSPCLLILSIDSWSRFHPPDNQGRAHRIARRDLGHYCRRARAAGSSRNQFRIHPRRMFPRQLRTESCCQAMFPRDIPLCTSMNSRRQKQSSRHRIAHPNQSCYCRTRAVLAYSRLCIDPHFQNFRHRILRRDRAERCRKSLVGSSMRTDLPRQWARGSEGHMSRYQD